MAQLIGILVVVALVALLVAFVVGILAYIVAIVAIPSITVMELIQFLGLTDPGWYVVLHALLGAAIGLWAHRVTRLRQNVRQRLSKKATAAVGGSGGAPHQNVRQRPLRETVADIWANRTHRFTAISILVLLVLISSC